ncbi:hypothetical protein PIB30_094707 [Stylosanthes scabra]|uniref:Uncharacterized protein n=1 Tax=Stylosanthes scabra TaxID=79078 RepID=A0ABU6QWP4_9FABA|nr:hypothetical protein [Stylosanthes scabra]
MVAPSMNGGEEKSEGDGDGGFEDDGGKRWRYNHGFPLSSNSTVAAMDPSAVVVNSTVVHPRAPSLSSKHSHNSGPLSLFGSLSLSLATAATALPSLCRRRRPSSSSLLFRVRELGLLGFSWVSVCVL